MYVKCETHKGVIDVDMGLQAGRMVDIFFQQRKKDELFYDHSFIALTTFYLQLPALLITLCEII